MWLQDHLQYVRGGHQLSAVGGQKAISPTRLLDNPRSRSSAAKTEVVVDERVHRRIPAPPRGLPPAAAAPPVLVNPQRCPKLKDAVRLLIVSTAPTRRPRASLCHPSHPIPSQIWGKDSYLSIYLCNYHYISIDVPYGDTGGRLAMRLSRAGWSWARLSMAVIAAAQGPEYLERESTEYMRCRCSWRRCCAVQRQRWLLRGVLIKRPHTPPARSIYPRIGPLAVANGERPSAPPLERETVRGGALDGATTGDDAVSCRV